MLDVEPELRRHGNDFNWLGCNSANQVAPG